MRHIDSSISSRHIIHIRHVYVHKIFLFIFLKFKRKLFESPLCAIMNEFDLDLRLDEDFIFILSFLKKPLQHFSKHTPDEAIFQLWLNKLSMEPVSGCDRKRTRNGYLCKLLMCMQAGTLTEPFLDRPKSGDLPALTAVPILDTEPPWLQEMLVEQQQNDIFNEMGEPANHKTYMSTKFMNDGNGACAYFAFTLPSNDSNWLPMESVLSSTMNEQSEMEQKELKLKIQRKSISEHIQKELDESVVPYSCDAVEEIIERFHRNLTHPTLEKLKRKSKHDQRIWLLRNVLNNLNTLLS